MKKLFYVIYKVERDQNVNLIDYSIIIRVRKRLLCESNWKTSYNKHKNYVEIQRIAN